VPTIQRPDDYAKRFVAFLETNLLTNDPEEEQRVLERRKGRRQRRRIRRQQTEEAEQQEAERARAGVARERQASWLLFDGEYKCMWEAGDARDECLRCQGPFGLTRHRHHCRRCGRLVCGECAVAERSTRVGGGDRWQCSGDSRDTCAREREAVLWPLWCHAQKGLSADWLSLGPSPSVEGWAVTLNLCYVVCLPSVRPCACRICQR
jgi:hypothetical protein